MNTSSTYTTSPTLIVTVDDSKMLGKVKNAIKMLRGVSSISVITPKKSEIDLAREEAKAGKVTKWKSVDEMFDTLLSE